MKLFLFLTCFTALLFVLFLEQGLSDSLHGVNRVNLAWLPVEQRQKIAQEISVAGFPTARLTMVAPYEKSLEAVREMNARNVNVLLVVGVGNIDLYPDHHASIRTSHGRTWDSARLSMLNTDHFRRHVRWVLGTLDAAKITLAGIEVGNEINWAHFNGDLVIHPKPNTPTAASIDAITHRDAFLLGMKKYIEALRIVREEMKASRYNQETPIISAGLAVGSSKYASQMGFEVVPARELIPHLQRMGLDKLVDAYGIHVYPNMHTSLSNRKKQLKKTLSICAPLSNGKPCWLTEWGLYNGQKSCPLNDKRRAEIAAEFMEWLKIYQQQGILKAAYYFDWDANGEYSLLRCKKISETGLVILGQSKNPRTVSNIILNGK